MKNNVAVLRNELTDRQLSGFIIPKTDEYQNEYNAGYAERLAWVSGFTGSAGVGVITQDSAALFVDGRYTLQARNQVDPAIFDVDDFNDPAIANWLALNLSGNIRLGYDPALHTRQSITIFQKVCLKLNLTLVEVPENPVDCCWLEQPSRPATDIVEHPLCYAGERSRDKCQRMGKLLDNQQVHALVIVMPDCIAWLLNVRASDIPHVPVPLSHAILYADGRVDWFVDLARTHFSNAGESRHHITLLAQSVFEENLRRLASEGRRLMLDESMTSLKVSAILDIGGTELVVGNPVFDAKACKNTTELNGARNAHFRDGVALVNFLAWLDSAVAKKDSLSELDAVEKLLSLRKQQPLFKQVSFDTISGAGSNGAIVHYRVDAHSNKTLLQDSVYLVDSGGQYLDGTTDVTRTVIVGNPTDEQKEHFTRVLQGHIALATCRFPQGTSGHQLDCLARTHLWKVGLDYGHGTGHGVGSYLGVHEGPQRVAPWPNTVALKAGMILSNEPGYYKEGEYGIRIENLVLVKESGQYPDFFEFETLTLAPVDQRLIKVNMLSRDEIEWLDGYHRSVYEKLGAELSEKTRCWLKQATDPLVNGNQAFC